MDRDDKKYLLDRLAETFSTIQILLEGVDLELRVYSDSDWQIRDILGHIATWDQEVTKSLRAFLEGDKYLTPDLGEDESDFNQQAVTKQRKLSTQQMVDEWKQAREDFKAAIRAIPEVQFPGDILYPWGDERGSITQLVEYMIEHDEEHKDEIEKFLQAQKME